MQLVDEFHEVYLMHARPEVTLLIQTVWLRSSRGLATNYILGVSFGVLLQLTIPRTYNPLRLGPVEAGLI